MYIVIDYTNLGYMGRNIILKHWFQLLKKSLLCCLRFVLLPIQCHWTARSCLDQVILELKGKYWPISSRLEIKSSFLYQFCSAVILVVFFRRLPDFQKHPTRGVLRKRCSENMQQIYRKTPMPNWSHWFMVTEFENCQVTRFESSSNLKIFFFWSNSLWSNLLVKSFWKKILFRGFGAKKVQNKVFQILLKIDGWNFSGFLQEVTAA